MPQNTCRRSPGSSYFFTLRLADSNSDLLIRKITDLRRAMRDTIKSRPFQVDAIAVLPSVIYTIWTLPDGDTDYRGRLGLLKSKFSRSQPMPAHRSPAQIKRGEKAIWQKRSWEHLIRDETDFARHCHLIHLSPVHAGLCPRPQDWPHTSLHRDLAQRAAAPAPTGPGTAPSRIMRPKQPGHRYRDDIQRAM